VAGAIRKAGGTNVQKESDLWTRQHGIVPTGCCTVTKGDHGDLQCKYIIHTVGPIWHENSLKENKKLMASCVANTLEMGKYLGIKKVSLPAISSGIYGFPKDLCAKIMIQKSV
jgi:O-acetyl-ADP-ribose deacetylase (regulator of RNase III)